MSVEWPATPYVDLDCVFVGISKLNSLKKQEYRDLSRKYNIKPGHRPKIEIICKIMREMLNRLHLTVTDAYGHSGVDIVSLAENQTSISANLSAPEPPNPTATSTESATANDEDSTSDAVVRATPIPLAVPLSNKRDASSSAPTSPLSNYYGYNRLPIPNPYSVALNQHQQGSSTTVPAIQDSTSSSGKAEKDQKGNGCKRKRPLDSTINRRLHAKIGPGQPAAAAPNYSFPYPGSYVPLGGLGQTETGADAGGLLKTKGWQYGSGLRSSKVYTYRNRINVYRSTPTLTAKARKVMESAKSVKKHYLVLVDNLPRDDFVIRKSKTVEKKAIGKMSLSMLVCSCVLSSKWRDLPYAKAMAYELAATVSSLGERTVRRYYTKITATGTYEIPKSMRGKHPKTGRPLLLKKAAEERDILEKKDLEGQDAKENETEETPHSVLSEMRNPGHHDHGHNFNFPLHKTSPYEKKARR